MSNNELDIMINEIINLRNAVSNGALKLKFLDISMSEYIALRMICEAETEGIYGGRTYLNDLSHRLSLSMRKTSKIVRSLMEKGLILWEHDGDGTDGTYMLITDEGADLLARREEEVREYFSKVISKFGPDDMKKLINMLKELETIMKTELEEEEDAEDES